MRIPLLFVAAVIGFSSSVGAQIKNPFANILGRPAEIKVLDTDDEQARLLKQCFNAAHNEVRQRYNYWLQGIGEIDGFLHSIDRLQSIWIEVSPDTGEIACVKQKLAFIKKIETQCEKGNSKAKYEALRVINEASVIAFRVRTELELAKLKRVTPSSPKK